MSAARIHIQLFGELTVYFAENAAPPARRFSTQKTAALLALLALSPGKSFSREVLIDRLWEDAPYEDGRRSLRVALAALRRVLEPTGTPTGAVLIATRESVSINADAVTTDAQAFERAARRGDTETARELFAVGELLPTFYDDWVLRERERLSDAHEKLVPSGGVAVAAPPPVPIPLTPTPRDPRERLPHYLTRYIGRETERENFTALLTDAANRLVTVTGTGGVGKTRFVTETVACLPGAKPRRFVSLADATDAAGLSRRVGVALGLEPANATVSAVGFAIHSLGIGLLVLDNMEQLVTDGAGDTVAAWLAAAPNCQIVATSRERLHISGEVELCLEPLLVPTLPATPERLLDFAAVRLFLDRARLARPDAVMTPRNAETVSALCERLDGLPLALEITASWAGALTFGQMLTRIQSHLLDETGAPAAYRRTARPERHRTLRAALDTSLELLSPTLHDAFIALSVFRGSFTADAALAVLGAEGGATETLTRLRERSLLAVDSELDAETLRFRLLPAIWEYARERYNQTPERALSREQAHFAYYLDYAGLPHGNQQTLDADLLNFRAALDFAMSDAESTLRLCIALEPFFRARGHNREAYRRFVDALAQAPTLDLHLLRDAHHCAGTFAYNLDDCTASQTHHEAALALSESLGDTLATGRALQGIASCILYRESDIPRVLELTQQARRLFQEAGDTLCESRLLLGISTVYHMKNDDAEALRLCEEALRLTEPTGDKRATAQAHQFIGVQLIRLARIAEAQTHLETAITLYREIGDRHNTANVLIELGTVAYENSDYDSAITSYEDALAEFRSQGESWAMAICLGNLGRLHTETGNLAVAATKLAESLNLRVRLGLVYPLLQSADAVINLLVAHATRPGKPFGRAFATEAMRLRAADNALRDAHGLGRATPDDKLRAIEDALPARLGETETRSAQAVGSAFTLDETVAALRTGLAKIR